MEQIERLKENCRNERGGYNMCKGMQDWLDRREREGKEQLLIEIIGKKLEKGYDIEEIADFLEEDISVIEYLAEQGKSDS